MTKKTNTNEVTKPPRPEDYDPTLPSYIPTPLAAPTEPAYNWNPATGQWEVDPSVTLPGVTPTPIPTAAKPTFEEISVPKPEVTPAPAYKPSPAQIAFEEKYMGKLEPWLEAEGYGIPEETQAQMIQKQTDVLKARQEESLRVMRNTMERRGITNSGFVFAAEQTIKSGTSVAIAASITDVQIKSALMKMASFEKAMGAAGQFLGYLSEQSQLRYAPEFATWKLEQEAILNEWQGKLDVYKMELNQAYTLENYEAQAYWTGKLQEDQQAHEIELQEIESEAANQAAAAEGFFGLVGTVLGFIFGL